MSKYVGTFILAAATLAVEISLTRILSVVTWYYLAFFAISIAMVGMTAGALTVYFKPRWFRDHDGSLELARAALLFSWVTPIALISLCFNPLLDGERFQFLALLMTAVLWMLPFYFSGVAIAGVLTRMELPIGRIYGADLCGAATGCLLVLAGLSFSDPMSLILVCAAAGALAALVYSGGQHRHSREFKAAVLTTLFLLAGTLWNSQSVSGIQPRYVKNSKIDRSNLTLERWNTHSQVMMGPLIIGASQYWGRGTSAPKTLPSTRIHKLVIDGGAATFMQEMRNPSDVTNLAYDVTNFGHYLDRRGLACIVGVGGGRDVQSAILFNYPEVLGIELNPIFIDLLTGDYADFAGLAKRQEVRLVVDEARSFLTRNPDPCSWLQMSLIDTWAATAAGAFSLSENALYTSEAFEVLYDNLAGNGLISVSRWYHELQIYETARLMGLVMEMLINADVQHPSQHIMIARGGNVATVLVSKVPFSSDDLERARLVGKNLGFSILYLPGTDCDVPLLNEIITAGNLNDLNAILSDQPLNLLQPTDDNPYFFNMLKLQNIGFAAGLEDNTVSGNIKAASYLLTLIIVLLLLASLTVFLPLIVMSSESALQLLKEPRFRAGAGYFMLIGLGFMFVEIALIQKFSIYLGHPIYSLGVLLFTIILATGCGSLMSEALPTNLKGLKFFPIVIAATLALYPSLTSMVISGSMTLNWGFRALITVALLFPAGLLMGLCFPLGMRMIGKQEETFTPWFWAMNGIMGVLGSCLAVCVSILFGISTSMLIGAACYAFLIIPTRRLIHQAAS